MNFIRWPTIGMRFLRANLSLLRGNWPAPCTSGCSPCKPIAAPCKIGCSIQTYEASPYKNLASCSVENSIFLRTNQKLLRRRFSVQIESFSVQNSMLLRTNRKRSKASPWKTTQRIGRPRIPPPRPTNRWNYVSGEGSRVVCKDILSPASKWSRPAFLAANIFKKMLNFAPTVGGSFSTVSALKIFF